MPGRLGIDFGTSNTVLALWNEGQRQAVSLPIAEYSHQWTQAGETVSIIPSLIHYAENDQIWIGEQVIQRDLQNSPLTMRWMKRYISHRSPMKVLHKGLEITPYRAGQDFLNTVLISAAQEISPTDEEVGLSVPVESFEHYENWLTGIAEAAGMPRFRLIDEPSAAALGYGAHIQPGNVYLIFDFGGGTMHTSVVLIETEEKTAVGRRCRVLGKAGRDIGGATIDQWLFQDVLRQNRLQDGDPAVRRISNQLLVECQRIKELLTDEEAVGFSLDTGISNIMVNAAYTRSTFDDLLDQNDLFTAINQIVRSTLNMAVERGYREEDIQAVLMVGGSSQIPSVQRAFRQIFGKDRVLSHRPLDAVALGTAAFVAGVDFYDHIQHDYAIRYVNSQKGQYDYKTLVRRGTSYPTHEPVARLIVKATHQEQQQLGIAIFEMSEQRHPYSEAVELVFDSSGAARITHITPHDQEQRSLFWMNEQNPTFLTADPPAARGEPRFEVEFNIDYNKRLTITARDIITSRLILREHPVIRLT